MTLAGIRAKQPIGSSDKVFPPMVNSQGRIDNAHGLVDFGIATYSQLASPRALSKAVYRLYLGIFWEKRKYARSPISAKNVTYVVIAWIRESCDYSGK